MTSGTPHRGKIEARTLRLSHRENCNDAKASFYTVGTIRLRFEQVRTQNGGFLRILRFASMEKKNDTRKQEKRAKRTCKLIANGKPDPRPVSETSIEIFLSSRGIDEITIRHYFRRSVNCARSGNRVEAENTSRNNFSSGRRNELAMRNVPFDVDVNIADEKRGERRRKLRRKSPGGNSLSFSLPFAVFRGDP